MTLATLPQRPLEERVIDAVDELLVFARNRLAKASTPKVVRDRDKLQADTLEAFTADVGGYFEAFAERLGSRVSKDALHDFVDDIDWDDEEAELTDVLRAWYERYGKAAYGSLSAQLGIEIDWDLNARGVEGVLEKLATQVKGITDTSRDLIRSLVATADAKGYSIAELVKGVEADGFAGLAELVTGWGSDAGRAYTIALTETANAWNWSAVAGYRDSGIVDEVDVLDGVDCGWTEHDDPDLADGSTRTLDEADDYPVAHPHCQRAFSPVVAR